MRISARLDGKKREQRAKIGYVETKCLQWWYNGSITVVNELGQLHTVPMLTAGVKTGVQWHETKAIVGTPRGASGD